MNDNAWRHLENIAFILGAAAVIIAWIRRHHR